MHARARAGWGQTKNILVILGQFQGRHVCGPFCAVPSRILKPSADRHSSCSLCCSAMNVLFKKAEEIGSKVFGVGNAPTPNDQPPLVTGVAEVELSYEQQRYKLHLDVSATAAAFCTQVYLATGVIPSRQKIVGFKVFCSLFVLDCSFKA
jgi:hypothetical protein